MPDWIIHLPLAMLSPRAETALRVAYGACLLAQLLITWPQACRYYVSQAHGGYIEAGPLTNLLHTRRTAVAFMLIWTLAAFGLITNTLALVAATIHFCFSRYFFLSLRWRSISRGMGAPGHMNFWFSVLILLLTLSEQCDVHGIVHALTVVTFRTDFALIMLAAGIYKIRAGYMRGEGFELGLVNPWWGNFARSARSLPANWWIFSILNHLAYSVEILCAIAFFIPQIAPYAALALGASFLVIGRLIRLTFLAEIVATTAFLYVFPGDGIDRVLAYAVPPAAHAMTSSPLLITLDYGIAAVLIAYLCMLIPSYIGMAVNLYGHRRLFAPLQTILDHWTGAFGLILWRVFTLDIINFYTEILRERDQVATVYAYPGRRQLATRFRFDHVGEFICLASIFTTLKYYTDNPILFQRRLLAYARTITQDPEETLIFRYIVIKKEQTKFVFHTVAEFHVHAYSDEVREITLDQDFDVRKPTHRSPIRQGIRPGSYAPLGRPTTS